jgi:hypothetical protein
MRNTDISGSLEILDLERGSHIIIAASFYAAPNPSLRVVQQGAEFTTKLWLLEHSFLQFEGTD